MNQLAILARDVSAYLQELEGRNVPPGLTWQLTRDYQLARCRALYGSDDLPGPQGTLTQADFGAPVHIPVLRIQIAPLPIQIDGATIATATWPEFEQRINANLAEELATIGIVLPPVSDAGAGYPGTLTQSTHPGVTIESIEFPSDSR